LTTAQFKLNSTEYNNRVDEWSY